MMKLNKTILATAVAVGSLASANAATTIIDPLSNVGDWDGTGDTGLTVGSTFSGGWVAGGRTLSYASNAFARAAGASDQFLRLDNRRNATLDTGYVTAAAGESYDFSFYTIDASATGAATDSALFTLYYTDNNLVNGTVGDSVEFEFAPTSTTAWDFSNTTGAAFTTDPGAGKTLFLRFNVTGTVNDAYIGADNISLTEVSVVPEPSTTALLGLGGIALILRRRRR